MSLATKAARGALWTVFASIGGRAVGVIGTLVMTRFLAPDTIGEVADATILCMTLNWLTIWGFGQYAVVNGRGRDALEVTWHATVFYVGLGVVSLGALLLAGPWLLPLFDAPDATAFIPGMALSIFIRRIGAVPERVLTRDMNFRASGLSLVLGEASFMVSAIALAAAGHGGMSIVYANIVQSVVVVGILVGAVGFASWATPTRLSRARIASMLKFGVPLGIQSVAHSASRYWDKLAISHFFGTGAVGTYNMAYNLADIPAIQVGEQIALVLMPSMASLPPERRPAALERSTALLSIVIFPLAVGLGLVAYPLIALLLPANAWQEVAPLLAVLTTLSVFRPITWVLSAFLEAEGKTNRLMFLEIGKVGLLLLGIVALQPFGLRAAAGAVGLAFGANAVAGVMVVVREGVSPARLLVGFVQPLIACGVMAAVVAAARFALLAAGVDHPAALLVVEIVTGAVVYVAVAMRVARDTSHDLLDLLRRAVRRH
jgi:PST family polysaccharide transporter